MKQKVIKNLLLALFFLVIMILPTLAMAQGGFDPGCDTLDPACPIDGGLSALLAIGAGYGIKKIREGRKSLSK